MQLNNESQIYKPWVHFKFIMDKEGKTKQEIEEEAYKKIQEVEELQRRKNIRAHISFEEK